MRRTETSEELRTLEREVAELSCTLRCKLEELADFIHKFEDREHYLTPNGRVMDEYEVQGLADYIATEIEKDFFTE